MVAKAALDRLGALAAIDAPATGWACYDWLHINGAGMPYVSVLDTTAREDARFWAETAQPHELECYARMTLRHRSLNSPRKTTSFHRHFLLMELIF
jgi:hypothetical protein